MKHSIELLEALHRTGISAKSRDPYWWPESGTFDVIVGAVLTQQTKWERVEESLERLRQRGVLNLEALANMPVEVLAQHIKPSGFYNTKARNLSRLCQAILAEFGEFGFFCEAVSREWLLAQKGIGQESADAILCYACKRDVLVVDNYTAVLLRYYGYEFESYEMLQEWLMDGLMEESRIRALYGEVLPASQVYARFHGKIVEFCKGKIKKGVLTQGVPGLSLE
jgi:endonuclease-3 related protein